MGVENPKGSDNRIPSTVDRRKFIKIATGSTLAAGTAALVHKEVHARESGLETPTGIFIPLYERHDVGIKASDLPPNLDGFFKEAQGLEPLLSASPDFMLKAHIKPGLLSTLAQSEAQLIFGDTDVPPQDILDAGLKEQSKKRLIASGAIFLAGYFHDTANVLREIWKNKIPDAKTTSRRKFIKRASIVVASAVAAPVINWIVSGLEMKAGIDPNQKSAIYRIYTRMTGLISHLAPENQFIFFRNLMMADKLLTVAKALGEQSGRKPRIAFNIGRSHSGIEDFLAAGHDFTRWLILRLPSDFLKEIIELNGGVENFCGARMIRLSKDFTFSEPASSQNAIIQDTKIYDQQLLDTLLGMYPELNTKRGEEDKSKSG